MMSTAEVADNYSEGVADHCIAVVGIVAAVDLVVADTAVDLVAVGIVVAVDIAAVVAVGIVVAVEVAAVDSRDVGSAAMSQRYRQASYRFV